MQCRGVVTHSEESATWPLLNAWAHRHSWLVSLWLMGERACHLSFSESMANFALMDSQLQTTTCKILHVCLSAWSKDCCIDLEVENAKQTIWNFSLYISVPKESSAKLLFDNMSEVEEDIRYMFMNCHIQVIHASVGQCVSVRYNFMQSLVIADTFCSSRCMPLKWFVGLV